MIIVEIPHQRKATAYLASEIDLISSARLRDNHEYGTLTAEALFDCYGEDVRQDMLKIAETSGHVVCVDGEFYGPGDEDCPSEADWARGVLFEDLNAHYELQNVEEAEAWIKSYTARKGHQWVAATSAVEKILEEENV